MDTQTTQLNQYKQQNQQLNNQITQLQNQIAEFNKRDQLRMQKEAKLLLEKQQRKLYKERKNQEQVDNQMNHTTPKKEAPPAVTNTKNVDPRASKIVKFGEEPKVIEENTHPPKSKTTPSSAAATPSTTEAEESGSPPPITSSPPSPSSSASSSVANSPSAGTGPAKVEDPAVLEEKYKECIRLCNEFLNMKTDTLTEREKILIMVREIL